jgi:drug/metabolite transporter (DMT)-like permease
LLIRYWQINAMRATSVVAVLSLCVILPVYFRYRGVTHLANLPAGPLVFQGVVQGLVQSVITIMAYNRSIAILGVSRAVLFPAIVPAISVLIGIPALGEIPNVLQTAGVVVVSVGMFVAVGALNCLVTTADRSAPIDSRPPPTVPQPNRQVEAASCQGC